MNYIFHILVAFTIFAVLGLSLNIVIGYCGRLSLCQGALYGLGAFVSALLVVRLGWSFLPAMLTASVSVGLFAFSIGLPAFKLRGDYFVLATLALQVIVLSVLSNWSGLTGGLYGLSGIPRPNVVGISLSSSTSFLAFAVMIGLIALLVTWQLMRSPYGRALRAVRDDPLAATSLGMNPLLLQVSAFAVAGGLAAGAGSLWAAWASYIDPTDFGLDSSLAILALVVVGGTGSLLGPVVGSAFMVLLPEALRLIGISGQIAAPMQQFIFGLALILAMRYRRQGIWGAYAYD